MTGCLNLLIYTTQKKGKRKILSLTKSVSNTQSLLPFSLFSLCSVVPTPDPTYKPPPSRATTFSSLLRVSPRVPDPGPRPPTGSRHYPSPGGLDLKVPLPYSYRFDSFTPLPVTVVPDLVSSRRLSLSRRPWTSGVHPSGFHSPNRLGGCSVISSFCGWWRGGRLGHE